MAETLKERKEIEKEYQWDLSKLYENDNAWEEDLPTVREDIKEVSAFRGKLNSAENILAFLQAREKAERHLSNLFEYASLRKSEDSRAEDAQKMYARVYALYVQAMMETSFAEPELLSLSEEELKKITESECLKEYRFMMEKLLRRKPHTLNESEERILATLGEVFGAPGEISDNLMDADMVFEPVKDQNGNDVEVTSSNYILLQSGDDRILRENAFRSFYKGFRQHINTFAATYTGAVKGATAEAAIRHYPSSRAMSMAEEHVPEQVYDNLIQAVRDHLPAMYRYVALRKKILQIPEIHYYDVYAPLVKGSEKRYTYEQAKEMVLEAVRPLGEEYVKTVRYGLDSRWVDVYPNKGKSGGAFSAGTYDSEPYILTNFTGTLDSVSTLAHEMGHSMHTWHSNHNQPSWYASYTLFVAEVASTVNENLLIEQLLEKTTDPKEKLAMLNQYLEGFKGTVYRQTMFAEFEKKAHELAEQGEALNASTLNAIYRKLIEDYFGPEMVIDEEVQYEWARIPHFYRPFYVYKYATSYSTAVALSEAILHEGAPAVKRYLEFLSLGGSQDPLDELKHAGADLTTPKLINAALEKFEKVLLEAEKTAEELK